jgi:hypothetical protein
MPHASLRFSSQGRLRAFWRVVDDYGDGLTRIRQHPFVCRGAESVLDPSRRRIEIEDVEIP